MSDWLALGFKRFFLAEAPGSLAFNVCMSVSYFGDFLLSFVE